LHIQPTCLCQRPQVCPYDCRHTLATICSHLRQQAQNDHRAGSRPQGTELLELYVYEPEPELLARHMLLLALLFEPSMAPRERAEAFLELHGNALLRQSTADWLGEPRVSSALSLTTGPTSRSRPLCRPGVLQPLPSNQHHRAGLLASCAVLLAMPLVCALQDPPACGSRMPSRSQHSQHSSSSSSMHNALLRRWVCLTSACCATASGMHLWKHSRLTGACVYAVHACMGTPRQQTCIHTVVCLAGSLAHESGVAECVVGARNAVAR
jgi:hypothetical protein